ncbi:MAG: hypothetical protein H6Q48_3881, partial [Deltaproteobacteria bacterium]|nr:hypothetical protein [Deltaproteobacteria bacterium]
GCQAFAGGRKRDTVFPVLEAKIKVPGLSQDLHPLQEGIPCRLKITAFPLRRKIFGIRAKEVPDLSGEGQLSFTEIEIHGSCPFMSIAKALR